MMLGPAVFAGAAMAAVSNPYFLGGLQDGQAGATSLSAQADGRSLVVVVMKGTWCPVCVRQLEVLSGRARELSDLGAQVVGLSDDSPEQNLKLETDSQLAFPVLGDPDHDVLRPLGLWRPGDGHPLPAILVFDRCGVERARLEGRVPGERPEVALFRVLRKLAEEPPTCGLPSA